MWSTPTAPVHCSLLRWWPLGRSMPCQVFSVFATPHSLSQVSSIIIARCVRFPPTVKAVKPLMNLSLKLSWGAWPMDLYRSGGKLGKCHLPIWLCPSPLNLQNTASAMMRDDFSTCGPKIFRFPWILLLTFPVTSVTIISKPRATRRV